PGRPGTEEYTMRKFLFAGVLAIGIALIPSAAQASWLSQAIHQFRGDDCAPPAYYGGYSGYVAPSYAPPVAYDNCPPPVVYDNCAPPVYSGGYGVYRSYGPSYRAYPSYG